MEHQFKPFDKIIVRDHDDDTWKCEIFSHYEKDTAYKYVGISDSYKDCLPYEGNEHLVGTYDEPIPPEPEFRFGDKVEVRFHRQGWQQGVFISNDPGEEHPYGVCVRGFTHLTWFTHCRHADW